MMRPQLNAEIWTVLPLPPTDPASLQASYSVENLPNIDAFLNLTVSHESGQVLSLLALALQLTSSAAAFMNLA